MELKVCGLSNLEEVKFCVENKINYCGFILNYPKSHRYISFSQAQLLTEIEKKNSNYVGVLVNPNENELKEYSTGALFFAKKLFSINRSISNIGIKKLIYVK